MNTNRMVNYCVVTFIIHHALMYGQIWMILFAFNFHFRFVEEEKIHKPELLLFVGVIGLLVNLIGLVLLYGGWTRLVWLVVKRFPFQYWVFIFVSLEHGGHHGHSHGITRSSNKLAQLANTDDNENNSFVFSEGVSMHTKIIIYFWSAFLCRFFAIDLLAGIKAGQKIEWA